MPVKPIEGSIPIYDIVGLKAVNNNLNGAYHLVSDIDLTGIKWIPIGAFTARPFTGVFDGQGHAVRNLKITEECEDIELFGAVDGATIINLRVEGIFIDFSDVDNIDNVDNADNINNINNIRTGYEDEPLSHETYEYQHEYERQTFGEWLYINNEWVYISSGINPNTNMTTIEHTISDGTSIESHDEILFQNYNATTIGNEQTDAADTFVMQTAQAYDSVTFVIISPASSATITYNVRDENITGVGSSMEYSTNGTIWRTITGDTLSVSSLIPSATAGSDVTLRIRFRAVGGEAASQSAEILLARRQAAPRAADVRFDGLAGEITGVTPLMEYRTGTTGNFIPVTGTTIPVTVGMSQTFQIRLAAPVAIPPAPPAASASATLNVTVPARAAAPNAVYNGSTDMITGVTTAREFSVNGGVTWTRCTGPTISRDALGNSEVVVQVRTAATATAPASNVRLVNVPDAPDSAPTGLSYNVQEEIITGVTTDMEFSTNGTTWSVIRGNPLSVSNLIPSATASGNVTLSIRVRATSVAAASNPETFTLARRQTALRAADVRFDGLTNTITGVNNLMEFRTGTTGTFTPVSGTTIPVTPGASSQMFQIRVAAPPAIPPAPPAASASAALNVTVPARAAAPNAVYNGSTDTITGVTTAREFSVNGGSTWTRCTGTTIPRSDFGNSAIVQVRTAATATAPASNIRPVNVPAAPGSAPGLAYDIPAEIINGVSTLMEYSTNGTTWRNITGDTLSVSSLIPSATAGGDVTLRIRVKATIVAAASQQTTFTLPRRQTAPRAADVRFDGLTERITGLTNLMEYRIGATGDFIAVPAATNLPDPVVDTAQMYQIRVRATSTLPASATLNVTVPARAAAPNAVYNGSTDTITGVTTAREFSLDGGNTWIRCTGATIPRSALGTNDPITVQIRTAATTTVRASNIREVIVPAAAAYGSAPDLTYNEQDETVDGVTPLMEFSTNGTTWRPITGNLLNVSSLIPPATAAGDLTLSIRIRATSVPAAAASLPETFTLARRQPTPRAADVRLDRAEGVITGVNDLMEYRIGTTGSFTPVSSGAISIPAPAGTAAQTFQIRMAAATAPVPASASATLNITVPASDIRFNGFTETITGVTDLMEYRIGTTGDFTPVSPGAISVTVTASSQTFQIRMAETATASASAIRNVTVPARAAEPNAVYNGSTDTITGVTTAREYSLDEGDTWIRCTGTTIPRSALSTDAAITVQVRTAATATTPASNIRNVSVPAAPASNPALGNLVYNIPAEIIDGVTPYMEYSTNGTTWISIRGNPLDVSTLIPSATASGNVTLSIRVKATNYAAASKPEIFTLFRRQLPPRAADIRFNGLTEEITGVTGLMEYRIGTSGSFTPVSPGAISIPVTLSVAPQTFQIRIKAVEPVPASATVNITVPARDIKFDGLTETITGVTDLMEYRTGTAGDFTRVSPGAISTPVTPGAISQTFQIRMTETETTSASAIRNITVPARAAAPGVGYNSSTDTITGVTMAREYSLDEGDTWIRCTGTTIPRSALSTDAAITVLVRTAATATTPASNIRSVSVPDAPDSAPNLDYNVPDEIVTGVTDLMEFSTNGTTWRQINGDTLDVSTLIPSATASGNVTLRIRFKAVGDGAASQSAEILLLRRQLPPRAADVRFNGLTETITGVTDIMEYRIGTSGNFTPVSPGAISIPPVSPSTTSIPAPTGTASQTFQIRVKAAGDEPASVILNITVPARDIRFNGLTETITGVTDLMEYRIGTTGYFTPVSSGAISTPPVSPGAISVLATNAPQTFQIRMTETPTASASAIRNVTIPARAAEPNAVYNGSTDTITGVTAAREYSLDGGDTWIRCTGTTIRRDGPAGFGNATTTVLVRTAATATAPVSNIREVIVPNAPGLPPIVTIIP